MSLKKIILPEGFSSEERSEKAMANFKAGFNCCQSVVLAFDDVFETNRTLLATVTSGLGGGVGRQREVCGCVSGMAICAGFIHPADNPEIKTDRTANYALVQELSGEFKKECGSIVCKELLGLVPVSTTPMSSAEPSDRTPEYYKKRPCVHMVGLAATIVADKIIELSRQ